MAEGQLAAGIAHDFRNLLASIMLYAELDVNRPDLPTEVTDHLQVIIEESNKAADLVQQILDFSGQTMIDRKTVNLADLVTEVVERLLRRTIPEAIELSVDIQPDDDPYTVHADPGRIQQVVTNLALNARDAMPNGGTLRFVVSEADHLIREHPATVQAAPGDFVCLMVADTGMGMTEEVRAHLFEPFFSTKETGQGTGLGLAQVYGIVRQHDGAIDVETEPGEGTTFFIYLPRADAPHDATPEPDAGRVPMGRGETILVVEDADEVRRALEDGLTSINYRVLTAIHGREALDIVASDDVDLVLTDIVMPGMGGKALLKAVHDEAPSLCVVGMTGYAAEADSQALRDDGFCEVISKPFAIEDLAAVVRKALDRASH